MLSRFSPFLFCLLFVLSFSCAQIPADRPHTLDTKLDARLSRIISYTVPLIGVEELKSIRSEVRLFDAREQEEYEVSHIEGAQYLGYDDFDPGRLEGVKKEDKIVLYCSIGYRSEKIGERLREMGYTNVYNLYGSIFDWVSRGHPVVTSDGEVTRKVHTYDYLWSRLLNCQEVEKVW
ncbi:MAG: rhodanese-like domain-containing protein [Bacteroidota bacterium]